MQVTDKMVRAAAEAMEAAEFGYQLTLTSLIDGEHTYTLTYTDEPNPLTFSDINDGYAHIAAKKRDKQARAALNAALAHMWRPTHRHIMRGTEYTEIGRKIYMAALSDRRGFRDDQVGIDDPDIWGEIFEEIGAEARKALRGQP